MLAVTGSGAGEAFSIRYLERDEEGNVEWIMGPDSYLKPTWSSSYLKNGNLAFWAPEFVPSEEPESSGKMYYSISGGGINPSVDSISEFCIGLAYGTVHSLQNITWSDAGSPVICVSSEQANVGAPHAIDPSVVKSGERLYLTFGSWSDYGDGENQGARGGGVWMNELDPLTGMLKESVLEECGDDFPNCFNGEHFINAANHRGYNADEGYVDVNSIEASYIYHHETSGEYFMFVNWFYCCRGVDSTYQTYQIIVGKSDKVEGPYYDKNGVSLVDTVADTQGTVVIPMNTSGFIGPGHAGIYWEGEEGIFTHHWEASPENQEMRTLHAWRVRIDEEGWPVLGEIN